MCIRDSLKSIDDSKIGFSYELIFVNDGSTDENTLQFLHQIDLKNAKILHKENGGASSARNLGLKNAVGDFILCLDADDILLPSINAVSYTHLDVYKRQPLILLNKETRKLNSNLGNGNGCRQKILKFVK